MEVGILIPQLHVYLTFTASLLPIVQSGPLHITSAYLQLLHAWNTCNMLMHATRVRSNAIDASLWYRL